jgi:hypothetical protein
VYICQGDVNNCYYVKTILDNTDEFDVPKPFDNGISYIVKVIDDNQNIIIGSVNVT